LVGAFHQTRDADLASPVDDAPEEQEVVLTPALEQGGLGFNFQQDEMNLANCRQDRLAALP
jgi:hypothetical protein